MLLATISVVSLSESGPGSLRQAIADASTGDIIDLSGLSGTITLSTPLTIDKVVTIEGPGADVLAISGNDATQVFYQQTLVADGPVTVRNLTIRDGRSDGVGGWRANSGQSSFYRVNFIDNTSTNGSGGAFSVNYYLNAATFEECEFEGNAAAKSGGAISTFADLTIINSTFYNNTVYQEGYLDPHPIFGGWIAATTSGGAISFTQGHLAITNSTFVGNSVTSVGASGIARGGALVMWSHSTATITNSTFTGNTASGETTTGAAIVFNGNGTRTLRNVLIAGNTGGDDAEFNSSTSGTNNLVGRMSAHANFTDGVNGNLIGTSDGPIDAMLGTFGDHGGTTRTVPLLAGSPAVNAGNDTHAPASDQRGESRQGISDIGAFELVVTNATPTFVTTSLDAARLNVPYAAGLIASDTDNDTLTFSIVSGPAWLTITSTGVNTAALVGTPSDLVDVTSGVDVTIRVSDGVAHADETFSLAVGAVASVVEDGVLYLNGTSESDTIRVWVRNGNSIRIVRNGAIRNHPLNDVQRLVVNLFDGHDSAELTVREVPVWISGGPGNDSITTGAGPDTMFGDAGEDRLFGMDGDDRIYGGDDDDTIEAGGGRNHVRGGAGNDTIVGGNSIDRLWGDDGDDLIIGRGGADRLFGGTGTDTSDDDDADIRDGIELLQ